MKDGVFRPRLFASLRGYTAPMFGADVSAGVTVGLIALPLALALGIASLPPDVTTPFPAPAIGLFTAIIAGFLVSALGGTRVQIGGPTAAFVPVVLGIVHDHGYGGLLVATVMAGVILVLMGLARFGTLIKFIPYPVTSGFTTGIAVSLILTQCGDFLGLSAAGSIPPEFLPRLEWIARHVAQINPATLAVAAGCVALIFFWPRFGTKRVPGSIVAMLLATLVVTLAGWQEGLGVATVGSKFGAAAIPHGLPPFHFPDFDFEQIGHLVIPATAIALLGGIESLLSAVVADGLVNDRHDSNTELIAQGVANIVCPFFCGLPATGAIARTTANIKCGARTPVAGLVHSATLLAIVLLFSRYAQFVPMAAMSAVLVMVAFRMGEWHELKRLAKMPRSDAIVLVTVFALTVVFDLVRGILVGMVLASLLLIKRLSETTEITAVTADDELETPEQVAHGKAVPDGVLVFRIFGPFFFGAAEKMEDALSRVERFPRVLILRMQLVPAMDATALNALESVVERLQAKGGTVVLSGPHRQPLEMMMRAGFHERVGRRNIRANFDQALARAREILAQPPGKGAETKNAEPK